MTRNPSAELPCKSSGRRLITDVGQSRYVLSAPLLFPPAALTRRPGNGPHSTKAITYGSSEWTRVECSTGPRRRFLRSRGATRYKQGRYGVHRRDHGCAAYGTRFGLSAMELDVLVSLAANVQAGDNSRDAIGHPEIQQLTALDQPLGPRRPVAFTSAQAESSHGRESRCYGQPSDEAHGDGEER